MQCKLKVGAKVVNEDFELEDGKYNAIVSNISSPVFDEKGDLVKEGVFEAMAFNNKAEADKYIDDRYNRLLQEYNRLQNSALSDLQKDLVEYQKERAIEEQEAAAEGVEAEEFDDDIEYGSNDYPLPYNPDDAAESSRIEKEIKQNRRKRQGTAAVKKKINEIFVRLSEIMSDFNNQEALEKVGEEGLIDAIYKEMGKLRAISKSLNYEMTDQEKADYEEINEFVLEKLRKIYFDKMLSDDASIRYAAFFDSLDISDQYKYKDIFTEIDEEIDEDTRNEIIRLKNEFLEKYKESEYFDEYGDSLEEENFVITSLEPNSVALASDINIVEAIEFKDYPEGALTQEMVDDLKVLMEENRASLELMGDQVVIVIREDKPGIIVNGEIQEKPKAKVVLLTQEEALAIVNGNVPIRKDTDTDLDSQTDTDTGTGTDTSSEEEPFDNDVDEETITADEEADTTVVGDSLTQDGDTNEELPYNLKATGTPRHRQKNLGSVLLYSTVKPSETKTVDGIEKPVNSKHETAMRDLWFSNNYQEEYGGDSKIEEFIQKSKEHIDNLTRYGKIKEETTIAYRKAKRRIYKNYNHELKLKMLNENQHEVLLMGVMDNGVFYPIGEVPYYDGPFDSNGKSLKNKFIGTDQDKYNYNNLYHTVKSLWDNTGYEPKEHKGYTNTYEAVQILARSDRQTIGDLINDRQEQVYFRTESKIYKYNRDNKEGKWEDITMAPEGLAIKKSYRAKEIKAFNLAVVKVGEDYEFINTSLEIVNTSDHDRYNRYVNNLLNLEAINQESISEFRRDNEGLTINPIHDSKTEFIFSNPDFNLSVFATKEKNDKNLIGNRGLNQFKIQRKKDTNVLTKIINLVGNAYLSVVIDKDSNGNIKMKVYMNDIDNKGKKTELNLTETPIDLGAEFRIDRFIAELQGITNLVDIQGKGVLRVNKGTTRNIASNTNNITNIILTHELKRRIIIKPNDYPMAQYSDTSIYEDQDKGTETKTNYEKDEVIAKNVADYLFGIYPVNDNEQSGFVKADNFEDTDYTKQANVFYHNGKTFIAGVSSSKNVVIELERLGYPYVEKVDKSPEEKAALKAYSDYMSGFPSDIIPIGIMTSAKENRVSYLVNDNGDIVSIASGSAVFIKDETTNNKVKQGIQNNNRSILGDSQKQEQPVPATEADVYANTEEDNNTSGTQDTSTPTETTTTSQANASSDIDFGLFIDDPIEGNTTTNKPITGNDVANSEDPLLSTSETKQTQQDISEAKRILANIVPFDVEEMDPMIQNMVNDRTPIGAFYKNVIYLLDGTVKFHEAFHGVFRTLLTDQEVKDILNAAKKKYPKPTLEDIRKLKNLTERNKQLTTQQIIDLYYEEKLADDFQKYMDTGKSFFQRVWQKMMDIINFITGKDSDRIYALFRSIEQGKYAKSKQRQQSPFAFREPAFATVNSIRANAYGKAAQYFMPPNQTKIVASLVAKEIFDDKIDRKKRSEYYPYFRKVRETFNPKTWYDFFKFNNDPNIVANMMTIIDYYNALAVPGDTLYMIDNNGKILPIVSADNIINKNLDGLIKDVDGLLKFYVNDENMEVDDEFNDDSHEDDNGESIELFGKDSYKFGGFKSESKAMRNLMSIITYNKPLFYMANGYMPTPDGFTGEIIMPSQAESLYNKITILTTGATKEDILERIKEGANDDKNPDVAAFYNYIMGKIAQESGIDNKDILVQEPGKYNNSPTYNLVLKSFYKNNHDYVHLIRDPRSGKYVSYYPNKRSYINSAVEAWDKNLERLLSNTNDFQKRRNDIGEFELIMLDTYKDIDSKDFMREMNKAAKLLYNATGISVSPLYLKYSYVKINNIKSSGLFNLTLPHIDAGTSKSILTELTRLPDQYSNNTAIRKMAEGSVMFDDKQTSFMLRNAENELIYTSLYNSYDTEIFNAVQRSFVDDSFRPEILRQALENMGYYPSFIERFMSMVSLNPMFFQEGLSAEDFNIMYSYGYGNNSYNKLDEDGRKEYRVGVYASPPANIKAKKGNKRLYNPFIIEAKNTNKLFTFSDTATGSTYENGEVSLTNKTIEALKSLYLIEKDSVLRYQNDIQQLITTGNIEALIKDYHYKEMTIDGFKVKVIFDGENYYEVEDKWDRTTFKTHQIHQGYNVRKINKPSGFKNPRGAEMFNFKGVQTIDGVEQWAKDKYQEFVYNGNDYEVKNMLTNSGFDTATDNDVVAFYFNDMIASASIQYLMFGGSPSINHKDFIDVTKRNAGINANGSSIGNTSTKFAIITSVEEDMDNNIIRQQNKGDSLNQDVQDAQNYATPLWYFSKYAKYKGVASEKGELRDIALKVVAGITLNPAEIKFLEKNNMLLIDRKIVVRNTFIYDKTSVHIQAREKTSRLLVSNEVALNNWKKYLDNPSPEAYNKLIEPMYVAKPGFEYHHNMLNSMEAQGIDIVMVTSASKNSTFNIASDPSQLRGFDIDDRFIHEQVRTDNIKKKITDPTQALALNWSEHQDEFFAKLAEKFVALQSKRMEVATNAKIATFFKGKDNQPDYEAIWDSIKDSISVNDPQLYELLDVQKGNPKYNWNIPVVNDKVLAAFMSAMSKEGISQKVKGSSLNLVSPYGHGQDLNWKVTDDRYPGTFFSEVYVSQYFLDKMGMKVGDVMWGTRIPTQDKHSMGNLKIKGIIEGPYAMSVMLPKELLFLSGADHDLDKMYVKTFAYEYSQEIRDKVYNKDTDIIALYNEIVKNNPNYNPSDVMNDLMLMTQIAITHNVGNQNIYATKASLTAIKDSGVRGVEKPIKSTIAFDDRNTSEESNYTSKGGIGPSAVINIVYQLMVKYFPNQFKFINVEGTRVNDLISTQISGMTDDPKEQLMSRYGLNKSNINKVIGIMAASGIPYKEALIAIRDQAYTYAKPEESFDILKEMFDNNLTSLNPKAQEYESEGYVIEYGDEVTNEEGRTYKPIKNMYHPKFNVELAKVYDNVFFALGTLSRLNRAMPVKPEKYFEILNAFASSNIELKGSEIFEGTVDHKIVSRMFNETTDDYIVKDGKIFINLGTHFMMYSFNKMPINAPNPAVKKAKEMARDMVYDVFTKDENIFKTVAAYIANGEFAGKLFMKFNPYYRNIYDIVLRQYKARLKDADPEIDGMQVISMYNKIINNLDNYLISILAARRYLRENNRTLYNGLLTETVKTKDGKEIGYMEALSRRILMEEEIRILKDVKYKQEKSNVTDKTYHIADLMTVGEESEYIRTMYSNDYANMINASENRNVLQQFINAPDKGKFMLEMPIGDAKLLMALFMFDYALMKDGMMFNATSFSKIIDPRLFVNYGKSLTNMQKAFTNAKSLMAEFGITNPEDLNGKLIDTATMIIESIDAFIKTRDANVVGASIQETYKPKKVPAAKVIYVGSGLGKTRFIANKKKEGDNSYVDFEDILAEALKKVTPEVEYTPAEASLIFGNNIKGKISSRDTKIELADKMVKEVVSIINENYKGKTILSTMDNQKINQIGMEYSSYFVASETNIPNVVERVGKRKDNQYSTTEQKYKDRYVKGILQGVDANKVFYVDDNFEKTFNSMSDGAFGENKPVKMSYNNKNYIVKGEQVFDTSNVDITNTLDTETKARLFAERDFRQGLSELVEINGEQFYQYEDGLTVFRLKTNSNLTPEGVTKFKQAIAKQQQQDTETEQEQETETETPTTQSIYDEYKSKIEQRFGTIDYDIFKKIVDGSSLDYIIELLKNC